MGGTVYRRRRQEASVVRHTVEPHQVVDPRSRGQRTELPMPGIDDQVETAAWHDEPASLPEPSERVIRGDRGRAERGLCLRTRERVPPTGEETLDEGSSSGFHSPSHPSSNRYVMRTKVPSFHGATKPSFPGRIRSRRRVSTVGGRGRSQPRFEAVHDLLNPVPRLEAGGFLVARLDRSSSE